jgi:hypothetical protein
MHDELEILPKQTLRVCPVWWPMSTVGRRKSSGTAGNGFRSLPFCKPRVPTYVRP